MGFDFHNKPGRRSKSVEDSFHEKYVIEPNSGCWIWTASTFRTGYGQFNPRNGRIVTAHRFSWELHNGKIEDPSLCVCHRCDVRECCNPDHLFLGTHGDNQRDKIAKGRGRTGDRKGTRNPAAKLTEDAARTIYLSDAKTAALAKEYGVSRQMIARIKSRTAWAHATEIYGV